MNRAARWAASHVGLLVVLAIAVAIGEVPRVLAACCAPPGATGLGTAWFINDFAQYESAMRQGATQSGWLIHDPFTSEANPAAFMFPLYVGMGKLAATLRVAPTLVEHVVEILARVLLVVSLWRFAHAFTSTRTAAHWAFALALFGSGFELFAGLASGALANLGLTVYTGNWSYETNTFGLLFAAPHVPLAMAATLELARDGLRPRQRVTWPWVLKTALLGAAVAMLDAFHVPVLLGAIGIAGLVFWGSGRGVANLAGALVAAIAALPVLWPTIATFSFQTFWVTTYSTQNVLPSPLPHELLVDLGPTLVLAIVGVVMLRGRVAPFGVLVWLGLELIGMYLPVPYQRRLGFGLQPTLAILAANGLIAACEAFSRRGALVARQAVVALAASGTLLVLVGVVGSGFKDAPLGVYRSTTDLDAAAAWLNSQATSSDVILADWDASNYLAPRTPARVFGGHPVATLHPAQKQFEIASVFAHAASLSVAHVLGVQWLVYGPAEAGLSGPPDPAFQSGPVRVYRVA